MLTPLGRSTGTPLGARTHIGTTAPPMGREPWIETCAERLAELNPSLDRVVCTVQAADLWSDVGGYDPLIAAEMEHEAGIFDD